MSKYNQYENEDLLALREKNWNTRFVLGKIPKFDAYKDINYLSLGLLKSKIRYEERIKNEETKSKYNGRLYSSNYTKSKSYAKPKYENKFKNNLKNERLPSMRVSLNSNKDLGININKKNGVKNVYNFPYKGTLTSYNLAGSNLFKYDPDYKNINMNHNYIDYICKEDEEISENYYLLKDVWEKLGVTEIYKRNFDFLLNSKYKNRDELLEMIHGERKQMRQFRVEFMKMLSEINKRESKIKDLKYFIKLYDQVLAKEKKYKNIEKEMIKDIEETNKEKIEEDIHECLKSLRLRTINTVNAIQKFRKNFEHLFNNKINVEILKEKYGFNEFYLTKLKNDLDFLKDTSINRLYHFSEKGGDPFLLCISNLCGNKKDIKKYRQVRISEEVLSVVKKYMFYLEQEDVYNMTRKKIENYNAMMFNNYKNGIKNNKRGVNENLLSSNFKGNLEKEKLRLKAENEYQNLFFNTEELNELNNEKKNKKEVALKTNQNEDNKYTIKGMTSKQLFRQLEKYSKIKTELIPASNKEKLKEKVKKNIVKNIEDRMKKVEIEFRLKMDEKFKKEENKIKEEEKRIKLEKEKIEKLCLEEEEERKKKEEKYIKFEKEVEERKKKDKKISEENEKFDKREKDLFVKEMQKKFLDEVDERFKKEEERQILFKKEMINEAEKREKERKEETERIRHEELEKIKKGEYLVDLRDKKKKKKKNEKQKKSEKSEKNNNKEDEKENQEEEEEDDDDDDDDEEEEEEEEDDEESSNNKKNNKKNNNTNSNEKDDNTSNNNKKQNNKESSDNNENISENIEEET